MAAGDVLVTGGPVWTGTRHVEAIGISGGRVVAAGDRTAVAEQLGHSATGVDVAGRRVIPGLIDSHVHVLRAGLNWNHMVRWDDITSLSDGLARIRTAAASQPSGSWIRVLGGWHPGRFTEGRGPTRSDLDEAAGGHPAYVQLLYEEGVLNTAGLECLLADGDLPGVDRDDSGRPTGRISGPVAFGSVLAQFEQPSLADRAASTRALLDDFAALGVTGGMDPGGFGISPESYTAMFDLWRRDELGMRVRLYLVPGSRGDELADIRNWVRYVQPGFGDDMLRYVGMGEIVSFGCHDLEGVRPFEVSPEARDELLEISDLLAAHNWPIHLHAIFDSTIDAVLDAWEEVDRRHGLNGRRFSLAHAEQIGRRSLERVRDLGAGIAVQNRLMYRSADSAALWGGDVAANAPPLGDILEMGIPLGAGTDATVVSPHDPWLSLWWLVTGRSFDGAPPRSERHRLSVEQALTAYTRGSAWFSFEEQTRGHLEPGALADLAVLDADPFSIDPDRLPEVRSDLTLVGGKPAHIGPPFIGALG
ncbi:MAG TPA: amidohydrolase [Acidimicrobiia bacterium]|nr:amidohydrolase [Acidimicrobiia bacterium]